MKTDLDAYMLPALFIGHGSPMYAISKNEFSDEWHRLGTTMPKPKAIISISAHWETRGTMVTAQATPPTIHDFGGFPQELYDVEYHASGNVALAQQISTMPLRSDVGLDTKWGFDHGTWCVLRNMFPLADVPVIQISLDYRKSPGEHYRLAKELAVLRKQGVLFIGSGNIVHNLHQVAWNKSDSEAFGYDWALSANETVKQLITERNHTALIDYTKLGKDMQLAVPTADHFLPLLYILAMQNEHETTSFFNDKAIMGSLTMTSVVVS